VRDVERELLNRVLGSRYFRKAPSLKSLLTYVCEHSTEPGQGSLSEYEIATRALARRADFDPSIDPIVRIDIARIRERLAHYFTAEGSNESLQLQIPKGEYRAVFYEKAARHWGTDREEVKSFALERFWQPYLIGRPDNLLVYSELLFLAGPAGLCVRNVFLNDPQDLTSTAWFRNNDNRGIPFRPAYHYVSSGEMRCALQICHMFSRLGVVLYPQALHACDWRRRAQANLIILGNPRVNSLLRLYQDPIRRARGLVHERDGVHDLNPAPGEPTEFPGTCWSPNHGFPWTAWVLVSRVPNIVPGGVVTLVSADCGGAMKAAGDYLTSETAVANIMQRFNTRSDASIPLWFQFLLEVRLQGSDQEVRDTRLTTVRLLDVRKFS
jgi:hypothetical protein